MKKELLRSIIYQVYVRNETEEGTFQALEKKLEGIKNNGAGILYLMPISPIGKKGRKGTLGSPYSIQSYEEINPELGTPDDFLSLVSHAHQIGLKVMMDIVFNHTSRDNHLIQEHEEYYYHENGLLKNRVGDWSDVYDLETGKEEVQTYLLSILKKYRSWGVDGFRFDVASFLPSSFYRKVRKEFGEDFILLAEAIDGPFLLDARKKKMTALSNEELFSSGFDLAYHYLNWHFLREYLQTRKLSSLTSYKASLEVEQASINKDGLIVRAIENHDQKRICAYSRSDSFRRSLLAFSLFTRGAGFVYSGEESKEEKTPSLFDKDTITFSHFDKDYYDFYLKNIALKKRKINESLLTSTFDLREEEALRVTNHYENGYQELGLFPLNEKEMTFFDIPLEDGEYENKIGKNISVKNHSLQTKEPVILALK